jgi:hypothetical protein
MIAVSKSAVEQRKATTTIFKCVPRSALAIKQFMMVLRLPIFKRIYCASRCWVHLRNYTQCIDYLDPDLGDWGCLWAKSRGTITDIDARGVVMRRSAIAVGTRRRW